MLQLQNIILEMVARGETLKATADRLCCEVEAVLPDIVCSVVTVDHAGLLHPLSGRGLPPALAAQIDGLVIGPAVGSCGSAAYFKRPVAVTDIATDPHWAAWRDLTIGAGLAACWSSPITDGTGRVIGAFAFYYRDKRGPSRREKAIVATCVHLCTIAIERDARVRERERRATIDALTGLGNRSSFNAMLARLSCAEPGRWGLFLLDLDNLKTVNDTFGHYAGDCLLQLVASRVAAAAAPDATFRLGGDEFVVVLQSPDALRDLAAAAERILDAVSRPADCGGYRIIPQGTIGGAIVSPGDDNPEVVRQNADFALYHAKETRRGGFVRYWPGLGTTMTDRLSAIREVEAALRDDRIEAWYQPIMSLDTQAAAGLEALCRLRTIGGAIKPAAEFHQATSDAQVATELTRRMLTIVARDIAEWVRAGITAPLVSVNLSSADLQGVRLETELCAILAAEGVSLDHLILEVTESVHLGQPDQVVARTIAALRARGLRIALDDFGTGFASLTHLLAVPVDIIKIDRSFVEQLIPGGPGVAIVAGLIGIGEALGVQVIAEGIETEEQRAALALLGCRYGQGYLFAPAIEPERVLEVLRGSPAGIAPDAGDAGDAACGGGSSGASGEAGRRANAA